MALTIRQWRKVREISQQHMARFLGVHINTYISWEKDPGKISIDNSKKIADALNVPIDEIIFSSQGGI